MLINLIYFPFQAQGGTLIWVHIRTCIYMFLYIIAKYCESTRLLSAERSPGVINNYLGPEYINSCVPSAAREAS